MATMQDTTDGAPETDFLDENHPLVQRFQDSLNKHLVKHKQKLTFELREISKDLREKAKEREDVGARMFDVQKELVRQKEAAEALRVEHTEVATNRTRLEGQLEAAKKSQEQLQEEYKNIIREDAELIRRMDLLNGHVYQLNLAKGNLQSDIVTLRESSRKVSSDRTRLAAEKQKQDMHINRITRNIQNLQDKLGLYGAQIEAIESDIAAIHATTVKAKFEAETLKLEGKQLLEQWNSSLSKMRNRDDTLSTLREAFVGQQESVQSAENEIRSLDKLVEKEAEMARKLSAICDRLQYDVVLLNKRLASGLAKTETAKLEAISVRRSLETIQHTTGVEENVKAWKEAELKKVKEAAEGNERERRRLQEALDERTSNGKCIKTSRGNVAKEIQEVQEAIDKLEPLKLKGETDLAKIRCELSSRKDLQVSIEQQLQTMQTDINVRKSENRESELKLKQLMVLVVKKRELFNGMSNKLKRLVDYTGGFELGPLELELQSIRRNLESVTSEVIGLQRVWLKQQTQLVTASEVRNRLCEDQRHLERQFSVYTRHRLQLEEEMNRVESSCRSLRRNIDNLRNGLSVLNSRAYDEHVQEEQVHRTSVLTEEQLFRALTERENELISLRDSAERIRDDEENLSQQLLEAENEMLVWQQKLQLSSEMKSTADSEYKKGGEIRTLQTNLHRMQVRFTELSKRQGGLVQGMEQAVRCWENLLTKGELQMMTATGRCKTRETNGCAELQRQMGDARRRLRFLVKETTSWADSIRDIQMQRQELNRQTTSTRFGMEKLRSSVESATRILQEKQLERIKNLEELMIAQKRARYYRDAHDGKYKFFCKSMNGDSAADSTEAAVDMSKHQHRSERLVEMIAELETELPSECGSTLRPIKTRLGAGISFLNSYENQHH